MTTIILENSGEIICSNTGIARYTALLFNVLSDNGYTCKKFSKSFLQYLSFNKFIVNITYIIWFNTVFVFRLLLMPKNSILISTNHFLPLIKLPLKKYVVVIHDIRLFKYNNQASKVGRWLFVTRVKNALKKADILIAVSETVKNEIIDYFNYPENKIKVVYNSTDIKYLQDSSIINKFKLNPKQYILSVSAINIHKNLKSLINAFNKISAKYPNLKLVLAGEKGNADLDFCKNNNIIYTEYIKDTDLLTLYKNALFYCSPSLYEGFGIPNIEAQNLGLPVLCSNIPVYKEIMQESAEFCEPNVDSIAEKIDYLINNPSRRDELVKLGYQNIKRFSSDVIKKQLENVLNCYVK